MKIFVGASLVFCMALLGLGSAIKCYDCQGSIESCTKTLDCKDYCLMLNGKGDGTYRQCIKQSDCDYKLLSQMFPQVSSFTFKCCSSDLCNEASTTMTSSSVLGLLVSLAVWWWCVL